MTQQPVPTQGDNITVRGVNYTVLEAVRLSDLGSKYQGKSYSNNISITAKRPKGKKRYNIVLYPSGSFSNVIGAY